MPDGSNAWPACKFGDIAEFRNGLNFTQGSRGQIVKVVSVADFGTAEELCDFTQTGTVRINGNLSDDDILKDGDLLFVRSNGNKALVGRCVFVRPNGEKVTFSGFTIRARITSEAVDPWFMSKVVRSPLFKEALYRLGGGSSINNLSQGVLSEFEFPLPPLPEQRKIAGILLTWDEAIDDCERRGAALRKQVDGLRLKLFEAAYASTNRVRQAKELFEPVSEKNQPDLPLLAVMQDIGVVRRDELDRRVVMPDGSLDGYKVVREGDFVISLRSFEGGLEFSRVTGLVSPAYTVLRPNGGDYVGDYYRHFFKSRSFIGRLDRLIFGIRDGKQISFRDFGDMKIPNPTEDEQTTAATVLGLAEQQIALADQEAAKMQEQKCGLMQKLLTGEWRVDV